MVSIYKKLVSKLFFSMVIFTWHLVRFTHHSWYNWFFYETRVHLLSPIFKVGVLAYLMSGMALARSIFTLWATCIITPIIPKGKATINREKNVSSEIWFNLSWWKNYLMRGALQLLVWRWLFEIQTLRRQLLPEATPLRTLHHEKNKAVRKSSSRHRFQKAQLTQRWFENWKIIRQYFFWCSNAAISIEF